MECLNHKDSRKHNPDNVEIFVRLAEILFTINEAKPAPEENFPTLRLCYMVDDFEELIAKISPEQQFIY